MADKTQAFQGYIRLSANYFDDPDMETLTWAEKAYYIALACRIRQLRTDGWITEAQAAKLGYQHWRKALAKLVEAGAISQHQDATNRTAYYLPGYLKWNYSEAQYDDLREKRRAAGLKSRCVTNHGPDCGCWKRQTHAHREAEP